MTEPWWPKNPPIYDIHKSYAENLKEGPLFDHPLPQRTLPPQDQWIDFLCKRSQNVRRYFLPQRFDSFR